MNLLISAILTLATPLRQGFPLKMEPGAVKDLAIGYMPVALTLSPTAPASLKKAPAGTTLRYASLKLGDGDKAIEYLVALDESTNGTAKIYVDLNHNGDLTDDGDGAWTTQAKSGTRTLYGPNFYTTEAGYATGPTPYSFAIYRISGAEALQMYRTAARVGDVQIGGKQVRAALVENGSQGLYDWKPGERAAAPFLLLDLDGNGKYQSTHEHPEQFTLDESFLVEGKPFRAHANRDGSTLTFVPAEAPPKPKEDLLSGGTPIPDFEVVDEAGATRKFSEYLGKPLVVDFWATWCGPCQKAMPHLGEVAKRAGAQAKVLIVCVWDDRLAFDKWVADNKGKYPNFTFVFDPAAKDNANSIAKKHFGVRGIPTTYVLDAKGNVADAMVGAIPEDERLEQVLSRVGVRL